MDSKIIFDELGKNERILLLRAFDYDIDSEGYILDQEGSKIRSNESPLRFIKIDSAVLTPGSLKVIENTPTAISKFIREEVECKNGSGK